MPLLTIINNITSQYGENVLTDAKRLKAFFADLAKDEPKPLRLAFERCVEAGAYNALKTAPNAAERDSRKAILAKRIRDEHGLDIAFSGKALDILEAALFDSASTQEEEAKDWFDQGIGLYKNKEYYKATNAFKSALRINPSDRLARDWLEKAQEAFSAARALKEDAKDWFDQGIVLYKNGEYYKAIGAFKSALRIAPRAPLINSDYR